MRLNIHEIKQAAQLVLDLHSYRGRLNHSKMATSMSDYAKASDLFGINKFGEFQADV